MNSQTNHITQLLDSIIDTVRIQQWSKDMNADKFHFKVQSAMGDVVCLKYLNKTNEYLLDYQQNNKTVAQAFVAYHDAFILKDFIYKIHQLGRRNINMTFEMSYPELYIKMENWINLVLNKEPLNSEGLLIMDFEHNDDYLSWNIENRNDCNQPEQYELFCYHSQFSRSEYLNSLDCVVTVRNDNGVMNYKKFIPLFMVNNYQMLKNQINEPYEINQDSPQAVLNALEEFFARIMSCHSGFGRAMSYVKMTNELIIEDKSDISMNLNKSMKI